MPLPYIKDTTYTQADIAKSPLVQAEYENCEFHNCNLSYAELSHYKFTDCSFYTCDLSLAKTNQTIFRDVVFKDCKMLGLRFDSCNEYGLAFSFDGCMLNHSNFHLTRIRKTTFRNCQLIEVDFSDCDLKAAIFDQCDLSRTIFDNTTLEQADFTTALSYSIDPEKNMIKKARFGLRRLGGLLGKYGIEIDRIR